MNILSRLAAFARDLFSCPLVPEHVVELEYHWVVTRVASLIAAAQTADDVMRAVDAGEQAGLDSAELLMLVDDHARLPAHERCALELWRCYCLGGE